MHNEMGCIILITGFVDRLSWDGTYPHNLYDMILSRKINYFNPLHSASSVHIPSSVNNFGKMLPTIKLSPWVTYY